MKNTVIVFRRELAGYFATPVAYVFAIVFLILIAGLTFLVTGLYEREQADLQPFFFWLPWVFLFLLPSISMRIWSEERKSGTIELLMTLPISMPQAVCGKFFAAWFYAAIVLVLTLPIWLTVNYLGDPDNGVILAGYIGALLLAGGYLAIGSLFSALTRSQVVAFVLTLLCCTGFVLAGHSLVLGWFASWAPTLLVETIGSFSFLTHFESISRGVIDLRDVVFFVTLIAGMLMASAIVIDLRKAK